jgi:hypothetical protein
MSSLHIFLPTQGGLPKALLPRSTGEKPTRIYHQHPVFSAAPLTMPCRWKTSMLDSSLPDASLVPWLGWGRSK